MSLRKRKPPIVLSVDEIAQKANDVVNDVDTLVAQLKLMIEERADGNQ